MPVWVRVHTSDDRENPVHYPRHLDPLRMACEKLEARLNGAPLPKIDAKNPMGFDLIVPVQSARHL
jgi:hypothetical protein